MNELFAYRNCFICGRDSRNGLKVDFAVTERGARASHTVGDDFEGFEGVVHGGILCALLDEIMWKAINGQTGAITVTAKMDVRFKKPVPVGTRLLIEGFITGRKRRIFEARGVITDREKNILAEATGLFMEMD